MFFNFFKRNVREKKEPDAAALGFLSLVEGVSDYTSDTLPQTQAVLFVLCMVHFSVRVLINVAVVLGELKPAITRRPSLKPCRSRGSRPSTPESILDPSGRRSVHSRPVRIESISVRSDEEEEEESSDESFTFQDVAKADNLMNEAAEMEDEITNQLHGSTSLTLSHKHSASSLQMIPEHDLLKGFVRTPSSEKRAAPRHVRHMSLDDRVCLPDLVNRWDDDVIDKNPPSCFDIAPESPPPEANHIHEEESEEVDVEVESTVHAPAMVSLQEAMDNAKAAADVVQEEEKVIEESKQEPPTATVVIQAPTKITNKKTVTEQEEAYESPCSSPRSAYSDSAATKFVVNFCNPEFNEDVGDEMIPSSGFGGSIRQRYTLKRLQSLLSQRSNAACQTPESQEGSFKISQREHTPKESMRSFRGKSFRGLSSFRSKSGNGEEEFALSDAYRLVRLESCIRKAWKMSMDDGAAGGKSFRENKGDATPGSTARSFKKTASRRFNRSQRVSFVKVPGNFSNDVLMSRKEMLLNPAFGDEEEIVDCDEVDLGLSTSETDIIDVSSVVMRTPLKKLGAKQEDPELCQKNPEEGAYNNPLRCCSFRSYDSDTELELTSVRVRNPISRLLSLRVNRGVTKDGISLAEIDDDEYGSMMFDQMKANPIRDGMLEKYLTQLMINDALQTTTVEDADCGEEEDDIGWSTCQQEWVPQELDDRLKCFMLDRFLLDNVLNEMDVNLGALEIARVQRKPSTALKRQSSQQKTAADDPGRQDGIPTSRQLRRS